MSLNEEDRNTLVNMYLDRAWKTYQEVMIAVDSSSWNMAANRLYYSLFHATTALFVHDGIGVSSHRGLKAKLGQHYVIPGKISSTYSQFLSQMETLRDKADYNILFVATENDILPNLPIAESFIKEIEKMITGTSA